MDATHEIVAVAATVTEARQRAERRVPRGMQVLSLKENWPHTGTVRSAGDAPATARARARAQLPVGATVVSETVLDAGEEVSVYAADAQDAVARLRIRYGDAVDGVVSHLRPDGQRGPSPPSLPEGELGPCQVLYRAAMLRPYAEVSFKSPARVALTFGPAARRRPRPD